MDYSPGPYAVTFFREVIAVSLNIPINDDNIHEDYENFNLTICSASLPRGAIVGYPCEVTVFIDDHDSKLR